MSEPLLKVENLKQHFPVSRKFSVKAVNGVSFQIYPGETYGLVGESGSGKTTIGRSVIRLYEPTAGTVTFEGRVISGKLDKDTRSMLRRDMQMIFQDPMSSLNPRKKVGDIIGEGLDIHHRFSSPAQRQEMVGAMLKKVGLSPAHAERYPHQFSGGQRQRVGIARALIMNPKLIIADECISALDVSIQAQVLRLLNQLKEEYQLTYIFITHDLSVVEYLADRIAVMYLGRIVELTTAEELFANTLHPYTKALLSAIPVADVTQKKHRIPLQGDVPSPANPPSGCTFHPRCPECEERCKNERPVLEEYVIDGVSHFVSCHKVKEMMEARGAVKKESVSE